MSPMIPPKVGLEQLVPSDDGWGIEMDRSNGINHHLIRLCLLLLLLPATAG